jgi:hypothetical protein
MALQKEKTSAELKSFGQVMALILFVLTAIFMWKGGVSCYVTLGLGSGFLVLSIFAPDWLRGTERRWLYLGEKMSVVMSLVILAITFYLVITPLGMLMRLMGKSTLKLSLDRAAPTYWERSDHLGSGSRFTKPY